MSAFDSCHHHFEIAKCLECNQPLGLAPKVFHGDKGGNNDVYPNMPHFNTTAFIR